MQRLGRGAFAEVWKALDTVEKRPIALKVAHRDAVEEFGRKEIEREARIATRLDHPHIVAIRNADWIGGRFVIASELARTNLADYAGARRSPRIALEITRQIAEGLAYAHSLRIMHRDVKPQNILIFEDRRAALGDFGASCFAKPLGHTYSEVGTLGYMAPEQAYGRPTFASDVFPLGVIAYELLTGVLLRWPFEWPPEGYRRLRAKVPEPVITVLKKAIQFQPRRRYQEAGSLSRDLNAAINEMLKARLRPRPVRRRKRRKPVPSPFQVQTELFRRRHGSRLGMRYRCNRCEGPIGEEMQYCPWCGTDDNSFMEITSYPLVCHSCERGVKAEWGYCPWCYHGRFVSNGRVPKPDPKAVRRCSRRGCTGELRPFMRYCPVCKQKTKRLWADSELGHRCPRCRWPVSKESWRYCPWCGRREPRAGHFVVSRKGAAGNKTS
jgi:serine/threonine-protein kinase